MIGIKELLRLVKEEKLIESLSERELTNPEGAGFDFRLGGVFKIKGKAFLGVDERSTPETELVEEYVEGERRSVTLKPGDFYLFKTIESVNIPKDICITFKPRTTTFRSGLNIRTGAGAPGYKGPLIFAASNLGPCEVTIEMGARIVNAQFHKVEGGGSLYRGQWQDGRVSTEGQKEKQV